MVKGHRQVKVMFEAEGYTKTRYDYKRAVRIIPRDIRMPNNTINHTIIQHELEKWAVKNFIQVANCRWYFENYGI